MRHWMLLLLVLIFATPTLAVDGVLEINQTCAVETGCFAGDAGGFPVTISAPGSYVLTGNLSVSDPNLDGIALAAGVDRVGIDLNNFEIAGPVICTGTGSTVSCNDGGAVGYGIRANTRRITVSDGQVRGFAQYGIRAGEHSQIRNVVATSNGQYGISVASGSIVSESAAHQNGDTGITSSGNVVVERSVASSNRNVGIISLRGSTLVGNVVYDNGGRGIQAGPGSTLAGNAVYENESDGIFAGDGCVVRDNTAYQNGGDGIRAEAGSAVQSNSVRLNTGFGLRLGGLAESEDVAYRENVVTGNAGGTVIGGTARGDNYCDGTPPACP